MPPPKKISVGKSCYDDSPSSITDCLELGGDIYLKDVCVYVCMFIMLESEVGVGGMEQENRICAIHEKKQKETKGQKRR